MAATGARRVRPGEGEMQQQDDAPLVEAVLAGDREAFAPLVDRWFDRCWAVSWRILHDPDLATDVAQDTLLTAWQQLDRLDQPQAFGGWVLRIARNRSLDRLRKERRAVPTDDPRALEPREAEPALTAPEAAAVLGEQRDLVWAAAAALGERDASLLDLHLRHGLEPHELADELGIAPNAAHQALFRLRKRLGSAIRAWLLVRGGDPECVALRAELAASGADSFGADWVRTVTAHVKTCEACAEEHGRVASPAALFSAVPLVAPPPELRARAVRAMADAGVATTSRPSGTRGADATDPSLSTVVVPPGTASSAPPAAAPSPAVPPPPAEESTNRRLALLALVLLLVTGALLWGGWQQWRGGNAPIAIVAERATSEATDPEPTPTSLSPTPSEDPPVDSIPTPTVDRTPTPTVEPTTAPQTTEPTASESPSPAPSEPVIHVFTADPTRRCATARDQWAYELTWESEHATEGAITDPDGEVHPVDPDGGTMTLCAPVDPIPTFTLQVVGPGGEATETASPPPPAG